MVTKGIVGTWSVPANLISVAEELYLIDVKETPGKILQLVSVSWSRDPVLRPVYTRPPGNNIYTITFHKYSSPCFVDLSHKNIYRTDGLTEKIIFSHTAPIQDLDYDSRGRMYVSVAPGAGRDGIIYHLKPHSGQVTSFVNVPVPLGDVRGFWNGYFAFDSSDKLYLSVDHPNQSGASIYEYVGGHFKKRFTHNERITGFTFANQTTLYFTTYGNKVYKLKNFKDLSIQYEGRRDRYFNDVVMVKVPKEGACQISGLLQGGNDLWPITYVEAYGPNVVWRKIEGSSIKVSRDGAFVLRNLPVGRYRIRADIHGETGPGVGFQPDWRTLNCGGQVKNIKFTFSR